MLGHSTTIHKCLQKKVLVSFFGTEPKYILFAPSHYRLITVLNVIQIDPFISEISLQGFMNNWSWLLYFGTEQIYFTCIVVACCTNCEYNHRILLQDIRTNSHLWKNCHNYANLSQCQILFYMHQQPMVPDYGAKYEENPSWHHRGKCNDGIQFMKKNTIITQVWHIVRYYFICIWST